MTDGTQSPPGRSPYRVARKLDVTASVAAIWRTFRAAPWRFMGLSILPIAITLVVATVSALLRSRTGDSGESLEKVLVAVVQYAFQFACQNACIFGTARVMAGGSFATREALGIGFRTLPVYVGMIVLLAVIVVIGFILLIIPGVIAIIYLMLAAPACVVERRGPVDSLKRSAGLVRGNAWRVIGVILLAVFTPFVVLLIVIGIAYALFAAIHLPYLALLLLVPSIPVFAAIAAILPSVLFVQLRALKEGLSERDIAGVFD